jgi:hypothetical protein
MIVGMGRLTVYLSCLASMQSDEEIRNDMIFFSIAASAWFWLPCVFGAYLAGRRKLSLRVFLLAIVLESAAIGFFVRMFFSPPFNYENRPTPLHPKNTDDPGDDGKRLAGLGNSSYSRAKESRKNR